MYNHLPQKLWDVIQSKDEIKKNKIIHTVHFLVENLRLRNANAQTRRMIVSTINVASGCEIDADSAFDDYKEVGKQFNLKRSEIKGEQSLRTFFEDVKEVIKRVPDAYPDEHPPVKCPVKVKDIKKFANKHHTPCRDNNAQLTKNEKAQSSVDVVSKRSGGVNSKALAEAP